MFDGRVYVYASAGINVVRKLQTQLSADRALKEYTDPAVTTALQINGKFDPATGKALLAAVDQRSPVWAPNVRTEIQAQTIGPSIMLATLWLAYVPTMRFEEAFRRIIPWGDTLYANTYTPLPWNTTLPETDQYSRDVIYSWREDQPAMPVAKDDRAARRAQEDARAQQLVQNPHNSPVSFIIAGALSMAILGYAVATASREQE